MLIYQGQISDSLTVLTLARKPNQSG